MLNNLIKNFFYCSFGPFGPTSFPFPVTPVQDAIVMLHGLIMAYGVGIILFVFAMLFLIIFVFRSRPGSDTIQELPQVDRERYEYLYALRNLKHGAQLEIVWTLVPVLILILIALPSLDLLYMIEDAFHAEMTIKVGGRQWYWNYTYADWLGFTEDKTQPIEQVVSYDSYMVPEALLQEGEPRLLKTDNPLFVPARVLVRFLITSNDVLHSFAIPAAGIKVDAVPGRLNQVNAFFYHEGTFFGQCSELCGVNHGFMPIEVKVVSTPEIWRLWS